LATHSPTPTAMRQLAAPALLALAACTAAPVPAPTGAPAPVPSELIDLHAAMTVPGLEDRRFDHATYWRAVEPYLGEPWTVLEAGRSAEGREIRRLTAGSGPTRVMLWSQMHGDESTASMALADLIRFLHEQPEHHLARSILGGTTLHLIPLLNPDGAERFQRRNAQGVDVNRDARRLVTPEGRALKEAHDAVVPDFGFNLHDQDPAIRVGGSNRQAAIALLAPAYNEARDVNDRRRAAMQVASLLADAVEPLVGDHVARYDDTFNARAFGDLMAAWGTSTVLIESGGWAEDPQKQHLRRTNFVALVTALDAIATGHYQTYGTDRYERLAYNGRRVPDLILAGGTVAVPGLPPVRADVVVVYDRPLLEEGGVVTDVGDLEGYEAQDTLDLSGLYLIPEAAALDATGAFGPGMPAHFTVAEDPAGERVRFRFLGGP
jgi:hypothetical protein